MSDLLKQAIADAKAVRATALSNAKAALEEHFTPRLQSMLSEKLRAEVEDAELGDEFGGEEALPVADLGDEPHADAAQDAAFAAPVEAPIGGEDPEASIDGQAPVEDPSAGMDMVPDGEDTFGDFEDEVDEARGTEQAGHYDVTQHGVSKVTETDHASSDYKKTTSGHSTEDPGKDMVKKATSLKTPSQGSSPDGSRAAGSNYKAMPTGNQIKNIKSSGTEDPQGASNELSDGPSKTDTGTAALQEADEIDEASLDEILKELEGSVNEMESEEAPCGDDNLPQDVTDGLDEEIDLNELLSEDDDSDADDKEEDDEKEDKEDRGNKAPWMKENISLKKELQEYRSAVIYLRDRINEVNLLNAKLLFTNKLFKKASLTNEQKLRVIESFDLTKSVREAKLVYATLAESFNFGGRKTVVKAAAKKPVSATVKNITEGLASKAVASTKPTNAAVLTEGNVQRDRFQKLAGIRK